MTTTTKTPLVCSAGDGIIFELVEQDAKKGFAVYDSKSGKCTFTEQHNAYLPMQNAPWLLPSMPTEYVNAYELFKEIRSYIFDHVEVQCDEEYDILAAWLMATYRFNDFQSFPYINAIGPKASGKTRLIKTLHQLSYRGIFGPSITASALFRAIDRDHVSVFFDQAEHLSNCKESADLLAIIDNGYQYGGKKILTNMDKGGDYEAFNLYSPKAFASTKSLEETLESRSIRLTMQAKTRKIPVRIDEKRATTIRSKLLMYKLRGCEASEQSEAIEETLNKITQDGRLVELYLPLYTVTLSSSFPSSPSLNIIEYMKQRSKIRQDEEQVSVDAEIIRAISECNASVSGGKVSLQSIYESFNIGKPVNEWWKKKSIAKKLRDLGFEETRVTGGSTGFYWNETLLKKHQRRFMVNEKTENQEKTESSVTI